MAASSRSAREAKRRIQQMEAKRGLRRDQEERRKRDNFIAAGAGTAAVVLAVVLQLTVFSGNPTEDEFAAAEAGLRLDPANQLLWRDLLRARYATDGVAGVRRTLDAMSPDSRTALLLAANGFSGREIAHALGRTELATRALLCRARTHLRETLEVPGGE